MSLTTVRDRYHRQLAWTGLAAILFGAGWLRLHGLDRYQLWNDELHTAYGALDPWMQLTTYQGGMVPWLFLAAMKLAVGIFGVNEIGFRLPSALAGIAAVGLIYPVTVRLTQSRPAGLFAATWLAVSSVALYYSQEAKPYMIEGAMVLGAVLATEHLAAKPGRPRLLLAVAVVGVGLAVTHAMLFVVGACLVRLLLAGRGRWQLASIAALTALAGAKVLLSLKAADNDFLQRYWQSAFLPHEPALAYEFLRSRLYKLFVELLGNEPRHYRLMLAGLLFAAVRRQRALVIYLTVPMLAVIAASALHKYPLGHHRLFIFLMPLAIVAVANVPGSLLGLLRRWPWLQAAPLLAALAYPLQVGARHDFTYWKHQPRLREAAVVVATHWQQGDYVFVSKKAKPMFRLYVQPLTMPATDRVFYGTDRYDPPRPEKLAKLEELLHTLPSDARVWAIYWGRWSDPKATRAVLRGRGCQLMLSDLQMLRPAGTGVELYDCAEPQLSQRH